MTDSLLTSVTVGVEQFILSFFQRHLTGLDIHSVDLQLSNFSDSDYSHRVSEAVNYTNGSCVMHASGAAKYCAQHEYTEELYSESETEPLFQTGQTISLLGERERRMPRSREFGMSCFSAYYVTFFEHSDTVETRQSWTRPSLVDASGRLLFRTKRKRKPQWPVSVDVRLRESALLVDLIIPDRKSLLSSEVLKVFSGRQLTPVLGHQVVCPFFEGYFSARPVPEPIGADILFMSDFRREKMEDLPVQRSLEDARRELSFYAKRIESELDRDPLVRALEDGLA